jgi:hypothetical protein
MTLKGMLAQTFREWMNDNAMVHAMFHIRP